MSSSPIRALDPRFADLVSATADLQQITTGFGFTEGVTWVQNGTHGHLLFSDIPANVIYRWTPDRAGAGSLDVFLEKAGYQGHDVWRVGMPFTNGKAPDDPGYEQFNMFGSNGITLDLEGRVVIATWGGRSIDRIEEDGRRTVVADRFDGKRFGGPNDVVVCRNGYIYFTDTFGGMLGLGEDPSRELDINAIYRIRDSEVIRVIDDIPNVNGLAFSPDETVLYANGSIDNFIRRYDVDADGNISNGSLFYDFADVPGDGITDGMRVDVAGNLWTTAPGGVWALSPDGAPLGMIALPEGGSNLVFGGPDRKTLYISAATSIYRIETKIAGAR
ncbi:SMP-30/gluconolactonase/LRE family protein [Xanthobacter aminoxidans]|uniref:SMP-30/gluconolactonase/LRE family protein n=1 Tax=Xanthobacter aminoxidans TaxID=186280 RepID=UPI002022C3E7|nr:SMP-30/gluconolactonase/LRE family protein [Xanthobacter aminoxidans]MCL8385451.1 SMP-30/gluconolactonase/LRE family protein [Xanthobacter aminoxidans]